MIAVLDAREAASKARNLDVPLGRHASGLDLAPATETLDPASAKPNDTLGKLPL